jgi:hypothetical protein
VRRDQLHVARLQPLDFIDLELPEAVFSEFVNAVLGCAIHAPDPSG